MYRDTQSLTTVTPSTITFSALRRTDSEEQVAPVGQPRIVDGFLGTSEGGFFHKGMVCTVPDATLSWEV